MKGGSKEERTKRDPESSEEWQHTLSLLYLDTNMPNTIQAIYFMVYWLLVLMFGSHLEYLLALRYEVIYAWIEPEILTVLIMFVSLCYLSIMVGSVLQEFNRLAQMMLMVELHLLKLNQYIAHPFLCIMTGLQINRAISDPTIKLQGEIVLVILSLILSLYSQLCITAAFPSKLWNSRICNRGIEIYYFLDILLFLSQIFSMKPALLHTLQAILLLTILLAFLFRTPYWNHSNNQLACFALLVLIGNLVATFIAPASSSVTSKGILILLNAVISGKIAANLCRINIESLSKDPKKEKRSSIGEMYKILNLEKVYTEEWSQKLWIYSRGGVLCNRLDALKLQAEQMRARADLTIEECLCLIYLDILLMPMTYFRSNQDLKRFEESTGFLLFKNFHHALIQGIFKHRLFTLNGHQTNLDADSDPRDAFSNVLPTSESRFFMKKISMALHKQEIHDRICKSVKKSLEVRSSLFAYLGRQLSLDVSRLVRFHKKIDKQGQTIGQLFAAEIEDPEPSSFILSLSLVYYSKISYNLRKAQTIYKIYMRLLMRMKAKMEGDDSFRSKSAVDVSFMLSLNSRAMGSITAITMNYFEHLGQAPNDQPVGLNFNDLFLDDFRATHAILMKEMKFTTGLPLEKKGYLKNFEGGLIKVSSKINLAAGLKEIYAAADLFVSPQPRFIRLLVNEGMKIVSASQHFELACGLLGFEGTQEMMDQISPQLARNMVLAKVTQALTSNQSIILSEEQEKMLGELKKIGSDCREKQVVYRFSKKVTSQGYLEANFEEIEFGNEKYFEVNMNMRIDGKTYNEYFKLEEFLREVASQEKEGMDMDGSEESDLDLRREETAVWVHDLENYYENILNQILLDSDFVNNIGGDLLKNSDSDIQLLTNVAKLFKINDQVIGKPLMASLNELFNKVVIDRTITIAPVSRRKGELSNHTKTILRGQTVKQNGMDIVNVKIASGEALTKIISAMKSGSVSTSHSKRRREDSTFEKIKRNHQTLMAATEGTLKRKPHFLIMFWVTVLVLGLFWVLFYSESNLYYSNYLVYYTYMEYLAQRSFDIRICLELADLNYQIQRRYWGDSDPELYLANFKVILGQDALIRTRINNELKDNLSKMIENIGKNENAVLEKLQSRSEAFALVTADRTSELFDQEFTRESHLAVKTVKTYPTLRSYISDFISRFKRIQVALVRLKEVSDRLGWPMVTSAAEKEEIQEFEDRVLNEFKVCFEQYIRVSEDQFERQTNILFASSKDVFQNSVVLKLILMGVYGLFFSLATLYFIRLWRLDCHYYLKAYTDLKGEDLELQVWQLETQTNMIQTIASNEEMHLKIYYEGQGRERDHTEKKNNAKMFQGVSARRKLSASRNSWFTGCLMASLLIVLVIGFYVVTLTSSLMTLSLNRGLSKIDSVFIKNQQLLNEESNYYFSHILLFNWGNFIEIRGKSMSSNPFKDATKKMVTYWTGLVGEMESVFGSQAKEVKKIIFEDPCPYLKKMSSAEDDLKEQNKCKNWNLASTSSGVLGFMLYQEGFLEPLRFQFERTHSEFAETSKTKFTDKGAWDIFFMENYIRLRMSNRMIIYPMYHKLSDLMRARFEEIFSDAQAIYQWQIILSSIIMLLIFLVFWLTIRISQKDNLVCTDSLRIISPNIINTNSLLESRLKSYFNNEAAFK